MTFNFRNWPVQSPNRTRSSTASLFYPRFQRPILVAQWHRGADGKLECQWQRLSG